MNGRSGVAILLVLIGVGLLGAVLIGMIRPAEPSPVAAIELRPKRFAEPADRPSVGVTTRRLETITEATRKKDRERTGGVDDAASGIEKDDPERGDDDSGGDDTSSGDEDRGRKGVDDVDDDGSAGEDYDAEGADDVDDDSSAGEDHDGEGDDDVDDGETDD